MPPGGDQRACLLPLDQGVSGSGWAKAGRDQSAWSLIVILLQVVCQLAEDTEWPICHLLSLEKALSSAQFDLSRNGFGTMAGDE